ncbi:hypothetical protein [Flavobacterium sp.]
MKKQTAGIINKFNGMVRNNKSNPKPNGPPSLLIMLVDKGKK